MSRQKVLEDELDNYKTSMDKNSFQDTEKEYIKLKKFVNSTRIPKKIRDCFIEKTGKYKEYKKTLLVKKYQDLIEETGILSKNIKSKEIAFKNENHFLDLEKQNSSEK